MEDVLKEKLLDASKRHVCHRLTRNWPDVIERMLSEYKKATELDGDRKFVYKVELNLMLEPLGEKVYLDSQIGLPASKKVVRTGKEMISREWQPFLIREIDGAGPEKTDEN